MTRQPRPGDITVIGVLWLTFGSFGFLVSLLVNAMYWLLMRGTARWVAPSPSLSSPVAPADWIFGHFGTVAALQLVVAVFTIYASWSFLKARPWARLFLEALCWFAILYAVAFTALWARAWLSMAGAGSSLPANAREAAAFELFGVVIAIVVMLFWVGVPGAMVWYLRRSATRQWFVHNSENELR